MTLALIAAVARNRTIGRDGTLPWHIPEDLKRFKTPHHRAHDRHGTAHLGIDRQAPSQPPQCHPDITSGSGRGVLSEYWGAPRLARLEPRVFIIGGAALYAAFLERADELYLTLVHRDVEGDTLFPPYEHLLGPLFRETSREDHDGFSFVDYHRV